MAQTWISVFWVAIPLPTLPLLWPSALRIWVLLAKSMPMPPWPHHPSRRKTKSPHITNKNTNNLEKSPIQPTTIFNFIIPKTLYVNRIVPIKIEQKISGMQIHHHENQNHLEQKVWTNFNFETSIPDQDLPNLQPTLNTSFFLFCHNLIYTLLFLCPFYWVLYYSRRFLVTCKYLKSADCSNHFFET